nr:MAG TPA: hypothetical protein [Caudoviricetes sp.]
MLGERWQARPPLVFTEPIGSFLIIFDTFLRIVY